MRKQRIQVSSKIQSVLLVAVVLLLQACNGSGAKPPSSSSYLPEKIAQEKLQDASTAGKANIIVKSVERNPATIYINGVRLATHFNGYIHIPLLAGDYRLKIQYSTGGFFETDFSVDKGSSTYLMQGGFMGINAYEVIDESKFVVALNNMGANALTQKMIELNVPPHKLLPPQKSDYLDSCINKRSLNDCELAKKQIPMPILGTFSSRQIEVVLEEEQARKAARKAQQAFEESLPKDILRDKYMLALSNALSNRQFNEAIPIFEKLQNLNLPLDPDFDYFYGEALFETGKNTEALQAISRYIRASGSQAQFYQESLELLNRIQLAN